MVRTLSFIVSVLCVVRIRDVLWKAVLKKKQTEECLEVIREALRHWDPVGVIDTLVWDGVLDNEYDSYAPGVFRLLERGTNAKGVTDHLVRLRAVSMGLGKNHPSEHEEELGEKLTAWKDSGYKKKPDFRFIRYAF